MTRTRSAGRPKLRLIWDEQLSTPVPRALRELGFNTTWVGDIENDAPPQGSADADVIEFAQRTNQIIVTSNHDMMLLCDEAGQRFVWIDPRGRQLNREDQVLLCFQQIRTWEEILGSDPEVCVRALRTTVQPIDRAEAARLAARRFRDLRRRQRSNPRRRRPPDNIRLVD